MSIIACEIAADIDGEDIDPIDDKEYAESIQFHLTRALLPQEAFQICALKGADYECDENAGERDGKLCDIAWINCDGSLVPFMRAWLASLD